GKLKTVFSEIIVVGDNEKYFSHMPVLFTRDLIVKPVKNSLTGVHAGLSKSTGDYSLVTACDMPFLNLRLIDYLSNYPVNEHDAVVPLVNGAHQALHAIYSKNCVAHLADYLEKDLYRIGYFITKINTKYIPQEEIEKYDPEFLSFLNINTQEDYLKALELVQKNTELITFKR
ncbi:MAG: hypothetical protein CVU88_05505, partial [Firmicutes bacterium HGW-Firmicutes-13]